MTQMNEVLNGEMANEINSLTMNELYELCIMISCL